MIQDPRAYGRREPAWVAFRDRWEDCHRLDCSFWDCLLTKASWIATNVSGPFVFNRDCWIVERGFLAFSRRNSGCIIPLLLNGLSVTSMTSELYHVKATPNYRAQILCENKIFQYPVKITMCQDRRVPTASVPRSPRFSSDIFFLPP